MPFSLVEVHQVSEEYIASIFRVDEQAKQAVIKENRVTKTMSEETKEEPMATVGT